MIFIISTHNKKKLEEISRILNPLGIETNTITGLGLAPMEEPVEDGISFEENARIKALAACKYTGLPAIADDSGLCVDILEGRPGIYSARYGGEGLNDEQRCIKLLDEMDSVEYSRRTARFVSVICVVFPDGRELIVKGECHGFIGEAPSGHGGFGYDPIFFLPDRRGFAQLKPEEKDAVSHRGNALRALKRQLPQYLD